MMKPMAVALFAAMACAVPAAAQTGGAGYKVTKTVPLGAPDRWDYVVFDPGSHRVYVAHGDRVNVVDGHDGRKLGEITGIPGGTHGVAISAATGKGYTDDGEAGVAVAFSLDTLKTLKRIPAQPDADAAAFDPASGHVFVINGDSATITVIDPKTDAVVATINGGGKLEYAVPSGDGELYVNGAGNRELLRIDTRTNQVDARFKVPDCLSPHGLALDPATHRAFISCLNKVLTVVDTDSGAVVASLPIGPGTDAAAFDPKRKLVFSSNGGDGSITVIREVDAHTFAPAGTIKTQVSGRTMGVDPATGRLYVAAAQVDPTKTPPPGPDGKPGRRKFVPGSLVLLFIDPAS